MKSNEEAVDVILDAIIKAGYKPGEDISICLDPAASEMWDNGKYVFFKSDKSTKTSEQMVKHWENWVSKYPIVLLEDGMAENDWDGWKLLTDEIEKKSNLLATTFSAPILSFWRRASQKESAIPYSSN